MESVPDTPPLVALQRARRRASPLTPVAVGATGFAAAAGAAAAGGFTGGAAARLVFYSSVGAAVAGIMAGLLLLALRRATVGVQVAVAALAAVVAVAIGVAWAASQMFFMKHDLRALWVVLISAGTVGLLVAIVLGRRVASASRSVGEMARRLGQSGPDADFADGAGGACQPSWDRLIGISLGSGSEPARGAAGR